MPRKRCHADNCLASHNLKLAEEWDVKKNLLTPEDVTPFSNLKVWWLCTADKCGHGCAHSWEANICDRSRGSGCPFCSGKRICVHESLGHMFPSLAQEFDAERNGNLKVDQLHCKSNRKVWWKCPMTNCESQCPHVYEMVVSRRTSPNHVGCPYCATNGWSKTCLHNSFAFKHPDLLEEWDWEHNSIDPSTIRSKSQRRVWWRCPKTNCKERCPHVYSTTLNQRVTLGSGCPFCSPTPMQVCEHNSLAGQRPDVMKFWHQTKNIGVDPKMLSCNSNRVVWWKCNNTCEFGCAHEWNTTIAHVSRGTGCPYCSEPARRVCFHKSLAYLRKDLMEEWDSCNDLDPADISVYSSRSAHWICKTCSHKWRATISSRTGQGCGCPKCRQSRMERDMGRVLDALTQTSHFGWKVTSVKQNQHRIIDGQEVDKLVELKLQATDETQRVVIELDGIQHFQCVEFFGGDEALEATQQRDARKNRACQSQCIHLLRIGYDVKADCYSDIVQSFFNQIAAHPDVWQLHCAGKLYPESLVESPHCRPTETSTT